jgi:hypothetical protein
MISHFLSKKIAERKKIKNGMLFFSIIVSKHDVNSQRQKEKQKCVIYTDVNGYLSHACAW